MLFAGGNAHGKTNLLEAIYLLSTLRSPRTDADGDLVSWSAPAGELAVARVAGRVERLPAGAEIEVQLVGRRKGAASEDEVPQPIPYASRRIRLNGLPKRAIDAVGVLNAVLFSTHDIELITGSPSLRRRYLDLTLTQVDSGYRRHASEYAKVTTQRNALLKRIQERMAKEAELEFWDERLVEHGAYLTAARAALVADVDRFAAAEHLALSGRAESLVVRYLPRIPGAESAGLMTTEAAARALREALQGSRGREIGAGMTLAGPHRDDLEFVLNGVSVVSFGSRAQQRTAALALRVAEARYLEAASGQQPVLLLDDMLSEMDNERRASVLDRFDGGGQVLITTAEPEVFPDEFLRQTTRFAVRLGEVVPA